MKGGDQVSEKASDIIQRLRTYRMSLSKIGKEVGYTEGAVRRWMKLERDPHPLVVEKLIKVLKRKEKENVNVEHGGEVSGSDGKSAE